MAALDLKASSGPFVVDPRYEFDAPQFWDLKQVSQGLESPETGADTWFDAGARGEDLPSSCCDAAGPQDPGESQRKPSTCHLS